mgnify:CR=1 FL=1
MNSDIVDRLRNPAMVAVFSGAGAGGVSSAALYEKQVRADMAEAADEIERLRAMIIKERADLKQLTGAASLEGPSFAQIKKGFPTNSVLGKFEDGL